MNTKNTPMRAWSRPYRGVSHLKETIKKGYQVSITHSPADDAFDGGYDWAIIALDGFCSIAEGTESSLEAARRSAEAEAERMRLIERSPDFPGDSPAEILAKAAPDLLEALIGLLNAPDPDEVEDATPRSRAVMKAHAAIAKATGGAK